jgi:hypothetical protein
MSVSGLLRCRTQLHLRRIRKLSFRRFYSDQLARRTVSAEPITVVVIATPVPRTALPAYRCHLSRPINVITAVPFASCHASKYATNRKRVSRTFMVFYNTTPITHDHAVRLFLYYYNAQPKSSRDGYIIIVLYSAVPAAWDRSVYRVLPYHRDVLYLVPVSDYGWFECVLHTRSTEIYIEGWWRVRTHYYQRLNINFIWSVWLWCLLRVILDTADTNGVILFHHWLYIFEYRTWSDIIHIINKYV